MFSAACPCALGLKPLLLRPFLSQPKYVASATCLSGVTNLFTMGLQKAHAKECMQEGTQTATTTQVIMAQEEVQDLKLANDDRMVDLAEASDGNDSNEDEQLTDLQVRMKKMQKLMEKFDEKLVEKEVTYTRVRRRAGVRTRC
eukprot:gnl/MRDRNA2_/MRDRNA2_115966_c0_seq1.p1 gnl/MRDRNA2_/MRDRNA2_115966_c0~~gnl/MRDRNA2_/MRDRNA2_115966_c0_seq1.p1  ORF type:complete len:143 (-),score=37.40 gnl/MRDRNA2_/MRDRNA2_115966_c0_seq1:61-489(-)